MNKNRKAVRLEGLGEGAFDGLSTLRFVPAGPRELARWARRAQAKWLWKAWMAWPLTRMARPLTRMGRALTR